MKTFAIVLPWCPTTTGLAQEKQSIVPDAKSASIVVDVQDCFVEGGLPVSDGRAVVPVVNRPAPSFENIVVTQDWHTPGHASFASSHARKAGFTTFVIEDATRAIDLNGSLVAAMASMEKAGVTVVRSDAIGR